MLPNFKGVFRLENGFEQIKINEFEEKKNESEVLWIKRKILRNEKRKLLKFINDLMDRWIFFNKIN